MVMSQMEQFLSQVEVLGIKHKLLMAYHPKTDGMSECTNKTVVQCLCYHIEQSQKGWAQLLPKVQFNIMNSINASTGFSPFIKTGQFPCLLPPLLGNTAAQDNTEQGPELQNAEWMIKSIENDVCTVQDSMLATTSPPYE